MGLNRPADMVVVMKLSKLIRMYPLIGVILLIAVMWLLGQFTRYFVN